MRIFRSLLIALALLALALPATALASGDEVIRDCADDGVIDGNYSDRELRDGERNLPSDIDEYTDCREAIRGELGDDRDNGGGAGGGGGRTPTDPNLVTDDGAVAGSREDIQALDDLTGSGRSHKPSVDVGGKAVTPGESPGGQLLGAAGQGNDIPTSLLTALILLVLMAVAGTTLLVRKRGLPAPIAARVERFRGKAPSFLRRDRIPRLFRR